MGAGTGPAAAPGPEPGRVTPGPVIDLADIRAGDAHRVGAKIARLGELRARGWRVPDGYAVTAQALADPDSPALAAAVTEAQQRLQHRTGQGPALKVAVRSSGISEDGDRASFAGQYDTYLGITGIDDVLLHIRKCRESGETARARAYRRRFPGTSPDGTSPGGTSPGGTNPGLAVGVLELVDAASAGVVFTLDPVTGDRGRLVVEANWGFGESVVSGNVSPDHWTVDRATGEILGRRTGTKSHWSIVSPVDGRVTLEPLPGELAARACLDDHEVRAICAKAAEIEAAEGAPQDVEWAIARHLPFPDSLFILQHRPETTWAGVQQVVPEQSAGIVRANEGFAHVRYALRNVFKVPGA
jgi:pyruvate, water dikinase